MQQSISSSGLRLSMQIRIKGYSFLLSEPFRAGSVLTRGEAQALNGLRVENIQNNTRKWVAEATEGLPEGTLLSQEALAVLQARLTEYDLSYQFLERVEARAKKGDLEQALREVALEKAQSEGRASGLDLSETEIEELARNYETLPAVIEEARARAAARRQAAIGSLEDL
jgi:hypothetical protein